MTSATPSAASIHRALLIERRWDLIAVAISSATGLAGTLLGGAFHQLLLTLGPFLGLVALYIVMRYRARALSTPDRVVASLHVDRDRAPLTWVAVFALSTWGASELVSALFGFSVVVTLAEAFPSAPTDALNEAFGIVVANNGLSLLVISTAVTCAVAVPVGRAIGVREAIHPYRWTAVAVVISRILVMASGVLFAIWYDVDISPAAVAVVHSIIGLLVFGAGALGVRLGARRRDFYRAGTLLRALPVESRRAAIELISEEARTWCP